VIGLINSFLLLAGFLIFPLSLSFLCQTKATIRCFPLEKNQEGAVEGKKCFYSGKDATHMAIFARAF
jgi:hypothetical protein